MTSDAAGIRLGTSRAVILMLLTLGLAILSLWLLKENRTLGRNLDNLTQPAVNMRLPALSGYRPDGSQTELSFASEPRGTLVLVFSKTCPVCDTVWPTWQSAIRRIDSSKLRVAFIDLSPIPDSSYLSGHGVDPSAVVSRPDPATAFLTYRLRATPQTILTAPGGRVKKVWVGPLSGAGLTSFMSALTLRERPIGGGAP
jgi:hypothetical protein